MSPHEQLLATFRFVHQATLRHWRKGLVTFAFAAVVAVTGTLVMPRSYYSEARLFVRFGRENQVDPTAAGGQMVALYESRESEINSLIEILKSRAILDRVVQELGADAILSGRGVAGGKRSSTPAGRGLAPPAPSQSPPSRTAQRAAMRLEKDLTIAAPRKSNIISVACKASSPQLAQQIVAKLVEVYMDEHLRVHRS